MISNLVWIGKKLHEIQKCLKGAMGTDSLFVVSWWPFNIIGQWTNLFQFEFSNQIFSDYGSSLMSLGQIHSESMDFRK